MAFPQSVLPVKVRIAPGGQPGGDPASWVWVDITSSVRVANGIVIEAGKSDEGAKVDPGKCTLTLDNRSGDFSTRNVYGQWYGRLAKNTPIRVGTIAIKDTFTRVQASGIGPASETGQSYTLTSPTSDFSVNGSALQVSFSASNTVKYAYPTSAKLLDTDGQITFAIPAVATGASVVCALMLRFVDVSNCYQLSCEFNVGGTISAKIRRIVGGTTTVLNFVTTVPGLTYTPGQKMRLRAQADGPALRLKVWADGGAEPDAWTTTASDTAFPDAGNVGFYMWVLSGNTNTKPLVISIDDFEVEAVEFTGTVPEWPPRWDKSRQDKTTPIVGAGILRRLQQGKSPLRSPITRAVLRKYPLEYWPFEDNSGALTAASALTGGIPAKVNAVEFAETDPPLPGASQTTGITASSVLSGVIRRFPYTGTWSQTFFVHLLAPPAAPTPVMTVTTSGTVRTWVAQMDATTISLTALDADGNSLAALGGFYQPLATPPRWIALNLLVKQVGGTAQGTLEIFGVGNAGAPTYLVTISPTGTIGAPTSWSAMGSLGFNGGHLAHVSVYDYDTGFGFYDFADSANGYVGETAAARVARLCAEESVQVVVEDGESEPLGPQRTDTFLNLLYSAEAADLGILYERGAGLAYRPRGARYNRPVELALDFTPGDVAEPPEPTDDDQQLRNMWTVTRDNGSSATALDQASINRSGLLDETITVNVATDDVLPHHAGFRVRLGTVDEYRWPKISLNLARNTAQIRAWRAAKEFPRMTIANEPGEIAGNPVDVTVLGYSQTLTPYGWDIDLNSTPTTPWKASLIDDADARADTDGSTLSTGITTTGTTVVIATTDPLTPTWSVDPADYPLDIDLGGERVTLTAVPSGSSSPQTFTGVTRSVNGIVKIHTAGEDIRLWTDPYLAL